MHLRVHLRRRSYERVLLLACLRGLRAYVYACLPACVRGRMRTCVRARAGAGVFVRASVKCNMRMSDHALLNNCVRFGVRMRVCTTQ